LTVRPIERLAQACTTAPLFDTPVYVRASAGLSEAT